MASSRRRSAGGAAGKPGRRGGMLDLLSFAVSFLAEQLGLGDADRRFRSAVAPSAPMLADLGLTGFTVFVAVAVPLVALVLRRLALCCRRSVRARAASRALAAATGINGLELEPVYNEMFRPACPEGLAMIDTFTATPAELPGPLVAEVKGEEGGAPTIMHAGLQREAELVQMDRQDLVAEILRLDRQIEVADMMPSCAVCVEPLKVGQRVSRLTCGHMFHARCLHTWLAQADSCPNCRLALRRQDRGGGGATQP